MLPAAVAHLWSRVDVPTRADGVTPEFLTAALRAGGLIDAEHSVVGVQGEPIAVGTGMVGELVRLRPLYDGPSAPPVAGAPTSLVLKLPAQAPENRAVGATLLMYEREGRFYADLAERGAIRAPRCYWSQVDTAAHTSVLLLEDLGSWTTHSQLGGVDAATAHRCVNALAGLHGNGWLAQSWPGWLPRLDDPVHLMLGQMYRDAWAPFEERFGGLLRPAMRELGRAAASVFEDLLRKATAEAPVTLCHGDFRLDNLLFDDAGIVAALDWQMVHQGPAVEDLAMFLTGSLQVDTRRDHERALVGAWHDRLASGTDMIDYPLDLAWQHYRRMTLFTPCYAVIVGGSMNMANDHARNIIATAALRALTAAVDLDAGEFLEYGLRPQRG